MTSGEASRSSTAADALSAKSAVCAASKTNPFRTLVRRKFRPTRSLDVHCHPAGSSGPSLEKFPKVGWPPTFFRSGHAPITEVTTPKLVPMAKRIEARGALDIARRAFQTCGQISPYVFPGERDHERPMSNNTILKAPERLGRV